MEWHKYTLRIPAEAEEKALELLNELDIGGIEIEDGLIPSREDLGNMFADISPELAPDEMPPAEEAFLSFYLRIPSEAEENDALPQTGDAVDDSYTVHDRIWMPEEEAALLAGLKERWEQDPALSSLKPFEAEMTICREEDWRNGWKKYYTPIATGGLLILPCWEDVPEEYEEAVLGGSMKKILLDPGTAFGSGTHESTKLCLEALKKRMKGGEKVLDIGCGSGILSLAALAYGAESVTMTELDPACKDVVEENFSLNAVNKDRYKLIMGNIITEDKSAFGAGYTMIVCNILAPVIEALAVPGQADVLAAPGACFITSGIYREHREAVEESFKANPAWELMETAVMGDWVSVTARRR